jgi:hypothetical protein
VDPEVLPAAEALPAAGALAAARRAPAVPDPRAPRAAERVDAARAW